MNFWEKLINKPPFYTIPNVTDTADFIKKSEYKHKDIYLTALRWVVSELMGKGINKNIPKIEIEEISAARTAAEECRNKALSQNDIYTAVRMLYVKTALNDYQRNFMKESKT